MAGRDEPALDELVEEVDRDGRVLRVVTRAEMRALRLRHRCTYVLVVTSSDELVVHQRASWKDVYPEYWDLAFGGVCDVGEDWETAARRELAEEAGLTDVDMIAIGSVTDEGVVGAVVGEAFVVHSDEHPTCPDGEVTVLDRVPIQEIEAWMAGRDVCEDSKGAVWPLFTAWLDLKKS